jgi:hypothetical protein
VARSDIDSFIRLVRGKEASELGPSFFAINRLNMTDMLQAFSDLTGVERDRFRQAAFDGIPGKGCSISRTLPEARQVALERIRFAYLTVVDQKIPATINNDLYQTGELRDAYNFLGAKAGPRPTRSVWTTCINSVCEDARLRLGGDDSVISGRDQTYGQAGWETGIMYGSGQFSQLPQRITNACKPNFIRKLAINAHGDPGQVAVNGVDIDAKAIEPALRASDRDLKTRFAAVLAFLDHVMTPDGVLLFHGCRAGSGTEGTSLLSQLSFALPGRKIVGFSTMGYQSMEKQRRGGCACREPGARDTNEDTPARDEGEIYKRYFKDGDWDDLSRLPWQSETSPHAKVALNGAIIRGSGL